MTTDPIIIKTPDKNLDIPLKGQSGTGFTITGFTTERERIKVLFFIIKSKNTIEKHKFFTSEPSGISARDFHKTLRVRSPDKEINTEMRFTAKNDVERVLDSVRANQAFFDNEKDESIDGVCTKISKIQDIKKKMEIAKKVRGQLHKKTHFQAVLALVNNQSKVLGREFEMYLEKKKKTNSSKNMSDNGSDDQENSLEKKPTNQKIKPVSIPGNVIQKRCTSLPKLSNIIINNRSPVLDWKNSQNIDQNRTNLSLSKNLISPLSRQPLKKKLRVSFQKAMNEAKLQKMDSATTEIFDKSERELMGKQVLSFCGVIGRKSPKLKVKELKRGQGHLMSGFGMSNHEIYEKVKLCVITMYKRTQFY